MSNGALRDDWPILTRFLPEGWEAKATQLGALVRKRKIQSAETLLRVLLIHLADGKSLRTTATYAREAGLCDVNDVALLHRLRAADEWFRWIALGLLTAVQGESSREHLTRKFRVRLVDGTAITQRGSSGTDWRIHYCFQLNNLRCDTFKITDVTQVEDFQLYEVEPGDLLIADRGYCKRKGITYVVSGGAHVLVRFHSVNLPLYTRQGLAFPVLENLRTLSDGEPGDWDVWFRDPHDQHLVKGRLCALRKSKEAAELAKAKLRRQASRKGKQTRPDTLEHAEYVSLFTTADRHKIKGEDALCLYRGRWQIELIFKRLKSIAGIGELPSQCPESCTAWLYGKLVVALLAERLRHEAEAISPWGYPLWTDSRSDRPRIAACT